MTLRQYAAIHLKVADSGDEWLDAMIRKSQRDEFAAKAMQGSCSNERVAMMSNARRAAEFYEVADAMLEAGK